MKAQSGEGWKEGRIGTIERKTSGGRKMEGKFTKQASYVIMSLLVSSSVSTFFCFPFVSSSLSNFFIDLGFESSISEPLHSLVSSRGVMSGSKE